MATGEQRKRAENEAAFREALFRQVNEEIVSIVPRHEIPDLESVVERTGAWDVVRKHSGTPTKIAERTDPRS